MLRLLALLSTLCAVRFFWINTSRFFSVVAVVLSVIAGVSCAGPVAKWAGVCSSETVAFFLSCIERSHFTTLPNISLPSNRQLTVQPHYGEDIN